MEIKIHHFIIALTLAVIANILAIIIYEKYIRK
jgi:hypothetical protein